MVEDGKPTPAHSQLMDRVRAEIEKRGLTNPAAASQIGVNANTLAKHLRGEHVRSDSALKYQDWLDGRLDGPRLLFLDATREERAQHRQPATTQMLPAAPKQPRLVADIFAGCGGLSLGFDLLDGGRQFRTVIAVDVEDGPIGILNKNTSRNAERSNVGRQVDLTDFMNEAEFLTFYVDHAANVVGDGDVLRELAELAGGAFPIFRGRVAAVDAEILETLTKIRATTTWKEILGRLDREALGQTSVAAFHARLRLPRTGISRPVLPNILWGLSDVRPVPIAESPRPTAELLGEAEKEWAAEAEALTAKREASGRGQLDASARRVGSFADLLASPVFEEVRKAWVDWRSARITLREELFTDDRFCADVRQLYERTYPISVLVGGPPCQGFSRIGRGKIRSLREAMVHAHSNSEAGDERNLLFLQYVMILGALRPSVFLFENVQHFQSTVRADGGDFQATEVLEEAVAQMSGGEVAYAVSSIVLNAARHGVPQNRLRYFMCGVKTDAEGADAARELAASCLSLPEHPEVPLKVALEGLPEPFAVAGAEGSRSAMSNVVRVAATRDEAPPGTFEEWVRRPAPGRARAPRVVDGHAARLARSDDARLFALMGPGQRWMDYRADQAETTKAVSEVLGALKAIPPDLYRAIRETLRQSGVKLPEQEAVEQVERRINGSLSLRLLLEQISHELGYSHHLLKESYLTKQDGSHGDWLAKMDPERPAKTMVSHMSKDTYGFIHPYAARTLSVREAARIQTFPDWFSFGEASLTEAFKMIGNAVPPLLSHLVAANVARILHRLAATTPRGEQGVFAI